MKDIKFDWSGCTPEDKAEILSEINNIKSTIKSWENVLEHKNLYNEFYDEWSHDKAKMLLKRNKEELIKVAKGYGILKEEKVKDFLVRDDRDGITQSVSDHNDKKERII
jgi:hypothetical protein